MRETNSETFLLSDGTYECVVYAYDKYYADENDALHPIDNTIAKIANTSKLGSRFSTTGTVYKNSANAFDVYFSEGNNPEVSIQYKDTSLTFSPLNDTNKLGNPISTEDCAFRIGEVDNCATLGALTATGNNTVTYSDVFADTDLVYVLENNALKEYIVLNSSNSSNAFSFVFTLDGLTVHNVNGSTCFTAEDGTTALSLGGLFAIDANGVLTEALNYSFTPADKTNKVIVTITLDENYLSSADRAFPVVIDPTIMISSSETADACVCSGYPNTNYKTAFQLRTGYDTDFGIRRSYIKFDIPSSIPMHSVTTATLDIEKVSGVAPTMRAYRCTGTWSSDSITWNNKPGYSTTHQSSLSTPYSAGSSWYTVNVTDIVQYWVNGVFTNYGFLIKDNTENNSDHWTTFYSSDADSPHKPELHITYSNEIAPISQSTSISQYMNAGYSYKYSFSPTVTAQYSVWTLGNVDTSILLYSDSSLSNYIGGATNGGHLGNACLTLSLSAGDIYYIVVRGSTATSTGTYTLKLFRGLPMSGYERLNYISTYNSGAYQQYTNCYTYALSVWRNPINGNLFRVNGINPGELADDAITATDLYSASTAKNAIVAAVKSDCVAWGGTESDFYEVDANEMVPQGYYKVALVLCPGWDYHWYRQASDLNGRWAHKLSTNPATQYDDSQEYIYIPSEADTGVYTEFLGYYALKSPAISTTVTTIDVIDEPVLDNHEKIEYDINKEISIRQFESFKANITTDNQIKQAVGEAHSYFGSGFVWEVYHTIEDDMIAILYNGNLLCEIRRIDQSTGKYEVLVS